MNLWREILPLVKPLRAACARKATYVSMALVVFAMCCLPDGMGVSGLIRSAVLGAGCYRRLLRLFSGSGVDLPKLGQIWCKIVVDRFNLFRSKSGRRVFILDGSDIAKSGRKMPGVHLLHNHSEAKNLATYYLGHSYQALSVLATNGSKCVAVPLCAKMDDGWTCSNRDTNTKLDRGLALFGEFKKFFTGPAILCADAYYCSGKAIKTMLALGTTLITRCRNNAVAYRPATSTGIKVRKRGRPAVYGEKINLRDIFKAQHLFFPAQSPAYGESGVEVLVYAENLLWRPAGCLVKFVWAMHPTRGNIMLLSTDSDMEAIEVVQLYGLRFKIEIGFKVAKHVVGAFTYRFWQKTMKRTKRDSHGQYLHRETEAYRKAFFQKLQAYHVWVQLSCVAQGLLHYLSLYQGQGVWRHFRSWLRTMRPHQSPSEQVVAMALARSLPEFIQGADPDDDTEKILIENVCCERLGAGLFGEKRCA